MKSGNAQEISYREVRHFAVYRSKQLVLLMEDRPGNLISTAHPSPSGAAKHSFLHGQALWAPAENDLGKLLRESADFDAYLVKLIENDFDVFSVETTAAPQKINLGFRIYEDDQVLAALHDQAGQLTTLIKQPLKGQETSAFASMSIYQEAKATVLAPLFYQANSFENLVSKLKAEGYTLREL